ncbi:MAG: nucleoside-diphosphate kinase [Candidatus Eisenbacteria bacterium]
MSNENRTLFIVKPDAVERHLIGGILAHVEEAGFHLIAGRYTTLQKAECETFYAEHKERPFFGELVTYMTSGPVFLTALEGEGGPLRLREVIGATDPAEAAEGTVRKRFGLDKGRNSVHASDSVPSAAREIKLFFGNEL